MAKIDEDGVPHCLRCDAEAAAATARPFAVNNVPDPGHAAMEGLRTAAVDNLQAQAAVVPVSSGMPPRTTGFVKPVVQGGSFELQVEAALMALQACPMPKDLKAYKAVAKARAILEKLIAPEQEN